MHSNVLTVDIPGKGLLEMAYGAWIWNAPNVEAPTSTAWIVSGAPVGPGEDDLDAAEALKVTNDHRVVP